jgi:hypothetical protein
MPIDISVHPIASSFCGSTNESGWSNQYSDQVTAITVSGSDPGESKTFSLLRNVETGFGAHPAFSSTETGDVAKR